MSSPSPLLIEARPRDLGDGFTVRRVLPSARRRLVGPFIFFDHMGPTALPVGKGLDVRPHPHIALATVTYLFGGEIDHRDSLGYVQTIRPGDVNWMVAGRGIVHSERSSRSSRQEGVRIHGIQSWVALPKSNEDDAPRFEHHEKDAIPRVELRGVKLDVIAGTAFGKRSPVGIVSPTLYVHALLEKDATIELDAEHEERAVYVVDGSLRYREESIQSSSMYVFESGGSVSLRAMEASRIMLVGGAKLDGERHIYWNFVSSDPTRIDRAKRDWREGRFAKVPGDDEFIPLPEE